jgi:tetratricopeptide (TPR) repeat protein
MMVNRLLMCILLLTFSCYGEGLAAQDFYSSAKTLFESNQFEPALDFLSQKEGPLTAREWKLKGDCYHKLKEYEEANESYTESLIMNEDDAECLARRGATYLEIGEIGFAISDVKMAIKVMPTCAEAYFNMGNICYDQGDNSTAKKNYQKALDYRPNYPAAMYMLGAAKSNSGDQAGATIAFESVLEDFPEAKYNLAVVHLENEDFAKAISLFDELEAQGFDQESDMYFFRAEAYYLISDKENACADYKTAGEKGDTESQSFYESYCQKNGRKGKSKKRDSMFISF